MAGGNGGFECGGGGLNGLSGKLNMAEKTELTSEEKLLGLIENAGAEKKVASRRSPVAGDVGVNPRIRPDVAHLFKTIRGMEVNFRWVNIALLAVSLGLLSYLMYDYVIKSDMPLGRIAYGNFPFNTRAGREIASLLPKGEYLKLANYRDIFTMPKKEVVVEKAPEPPPPAPQVDPVEGIKGNMGLVGVIWGKKPQILIENKREGRTYLLGEGDNTGQSRVKKIFKDKVIFEFEGREFELI